MAIAIVFTPTWMGVTEYNECIKILEEAGAGAPAGRRFHACYTNGEQLQVFDIWDSKESFDEFGQILIPVLQRLGVDPGTPAISEVHNIIESDKTT